MESSTEAIFDEAQYRAHVLHHPSPESEAAQARHLAEEAQQLGLQVPEIPKSAPLASIASGMVDLTSPVLSSGSSTDRNSACGSVTPSHDPSSPVSSVLDQIVASLSDVTLASDRIKAGSTRSLASLSTRPTSFCSSEGKTGLTGHGYNDPFEAKSHRHSILSVASADKKEKRRSSLKSAIGRIHFRKKRTSSALVLPSDPRMNVSTGDKGVEHVFFEPKPEPNNAAHENAPPHARTEASLPRLAIPLFSKEMLQRSLDDPELSEVHERHRMERSRHLAFQDAALSTLRRRHQTALSEQQSDNQRQEDEKREKNIEAIAQIEERQLAVEIEQQREFDRAKINSRTRIKHMEGFLRNTSPPPSPAGTSTRTSTRTSTGTERCSESFSESEFTPPARVFTRQHMEQLEQQYHSHKSMDQLHEARIKVLRDRQEVKLQEATARMEKELDEMCNRHLQVVATLQAEHQREEASLMQALDTKKKTLRHRWHLEEAVLRRHLEVRHGQSYGPLPTLTFTTPNTPSVADHSPLETSTPDTIHPSQDCRAL